MQLTITNGYDRETGDHYWRINVCGIFCKDTSDPMVLGECLEEYIRQDWNGHLKAYGSYLERTKNDIIYIHGSRNQ